MIGRAIYKLRPGAEWALDGASIIWEPILDENKQPTGEYNTPNFRWLDKVQSKPSKEEIETALAEVEAEYAATEYQRLRRPEYPDLAQLADAIYWQAQGDDSKMTAYLAAVEEVKQKYPKE